MVGFPGVGKSTLLYSFAVKQCRQWQVALVDMRMISDKIEIKDQLEDIALKAIQRINPDFQGSALAKAQEVFQQENTCLVLDNLEDTALLEQVRKQLNPQKLLVSSRQHSSALGIELVKLEHLISSAAEAMFREQGQVPSGHGAAIAQICADLGYLPLAIKLVASYYRSYGLSLEQVAQEVQRDLDPGATSYTTTNDRQRAEQSVRVAFELSYNKLTEAKNAFLAFGILSPNGATCGTVAYVLDAVHLVAWKQLQSLKKLSLLEVVDDYNLQASEATNTEYTQAHTLFRTHKLLGDFAREKLTQDPSTQTSLTSRVDALLSDALHRANQHIAGHRLNLDLPFIGLHREQIRFLGVLQLADSSTERDSVKGIWNASVMIGDAGYFIEALQLDLEIVTFFRKLVRQNCDEFLPDLAGSLNNLNNRQSEIGDHWGALDTAQEAVQCYRALASRNPDTFLLNLAHSLTNLSSRLGAVGDFHTGLVNAQEAMGFYQELASRNGHGFLPELAGGLINLGNRQNEVGDYNSALITTQEAVRCYRRLVSSNRGVFLPSLTTSLNNLSVIQSRVSNHYGAIHTATEAVNYCRELVSSNRQAFLPDLGRSLSNLSALQKYVRNHHGALASAQEAVMHYRELVSYKQDAFLPALASSLNNLSSCQSDIGDWESALASASEGIQLKQQLYRSNPRAIAQQLVNSYGALGNIYEALERIDEARAAAEQGLQVLLPMLQTYPQVFAQIAQVLRSQYLKRSQNLQLEPDMQLLGQVEATLKTLQAEAS